MLKAGFSAKKMSTMKPSSPLTCAGNHILKLLQLFLQLNHLYLTLSFSGIMIRICIFSGLLPYVVSWWSTFAPPTPPTPRLKLLTTREHLPPCNCLVIDLTSEQSHQPKRIIMRKVVLMMSLGFGTLRHPGNFDPGYTFWNGTTVKS